MIDVIETRRYIHRALDSAIENGYTELLGMTPHAVLMDLADFDSEVEKMDPFGDKKPAAHLMYFLEVVKDWLRAHGGLH